MSDQDGVWVEIDGKLHPKVNKVRFKAKFVEVNTVSPDFTAFSPGSIDVSKLNRSVNASVTLEPGPAWDDFVTSLQEWSERANEWGRSVFAGIATGLRKLERGLECFWLDVHLEEYPYWPNDEGQRRLAKVLATEIYKEHQSDEVTPFRAADMACYKVRYGGLQRQFIVLSGREALRERVREIRGW